MEDGLEHLEALYILHDGAGALHGYDIDPLSRGRA